MRSTHPIKHKAALSVRLLGALIIITALIFPFLSKAEANTRHGIGGVLGYNTASDIETTYQNTTGETEQTYVGNGAFLLGVRYAHMLTDQIGFSGEFYFEFERQISQLEFESGEEERGNDTYTVTSFEGNSFFHIYEGAFVIGGFNFSTPNISFEGDVSASGNFGIQVGGGYVFLPNFNVELLYKTQNFDFSDGGTSSNTARLWGIVLRAAYQFDLFGGGSGGSGDADFAF